MDVLSVVVAVVICVVVSLALYVAYITRNFRVFKKLGIPHLTPLPGIGNALAFSKYGLLEFHLRTYKQFPSEKMYGYCEPGLAVLVVKDLDLIKDIMVKNFNSFVNRRPFTSQKPFVNILTALQDDHWRRVRNAVSPTFSTGRIRQMCLHVEQSAQRLVSNLRESCQKKEEVEMKDAMACFTMDAIASSGFGVSIDSLKDRSCPFVENAKDLLNFGVGFWILAIFFPPVLSLLAKLGICLFKKKPIEFFCSFIDAALQNRKVGDGADTKLNDFIQLLINEGNKHKDSMKAHDNVETKHQPDGLSYEDIQGQAIIFLLAGYDTVATTLSFTMFSLANNPEICRKLHEEVDTVLEGKFPTYETAQALPYLDICIHEALRMYPSVFNIDKVVIPVTAIHHDPEIFSDPHKFDPERFSPENKESRHPFSHLPFGQGARNCIGMRLALMEVKIAMAAILQEMTPVKSNKTVYPPKLSKFQMKAEDGLWIKLVSRKEE